MEGVKHKPQHHRLFDQPRVCEGKRCYANKHEAELVKEEQEALKDDLELSIYRCLTCKQWHLTRTNRDN